MASLNFDLEIFCDIYCCGKFGDLIDSQIARVTSRSDEGDQLEIVRSQSFCLLQSVCYNAGFAIVCFIHK